MLKKAKELKQLNIQDVLCYLCDQKDNLIVARKDKYLWRKCFNCGLLYISAFPEKDYYDKEYFRAYKNLADYNYKLAENILPKASNLIWPAGGNGRLLEIGCGGGYFLKKAKELGWKVQGIEQSEAACNIAKENSLNLIQANVEEYVFNFKNPLDLIVMHHVIEHLRNPVDTLEKIKKTLSKKGVIFNVCPDGDQYTDSSWLHINNHWPGEHIIIYNRSSFEYLAAKVGLKCFDFYWELGQFSCWLKKI